MAVLSFRKQLRRKYRKYRSILVLANSLRRKERALVDYTEAAIATLPAAKLRAKATELEQALRYAIELYGVVGSLEDMDETLSSGGEISGIGPQNLLCISKYHLLRLFQRYERALPAFPKLPLHARVGIDILNIRESTSEMEVFQLEASLFEDMADLLNEAVRSGEVAVGPNSSKVQSKHAGACMRAAAKAAFNLLEGYLNGLAGDIILVRTVSPRDRAKLTEWDEERQRPIFLSLREKLLQYPKIATGREHPVLQANSCRAMERVLRLERRLRHALIHPRPQVLPADSESFREAAFFELKLEEVAILCDDVIELISFISAAVGPEFGDVSLWLACRQPDGLFGDDVFY